MCGKRRYYSLYVVCQEQSFLYDEEVDCHRERCALSEKHPYNCKSYSCISIRQPTESVILEEKPELCKRCKTDPVHAQEVVDRRAGKRPIRSYSPNPNPNPRITYGPLDAQRDYQMDRLDIDDVNALAAANALLASGATQVTSPGATSAAPTSDARLATSDSTQVNAPGLDATKEAPSGGPSTA